MQEQIKALMKEWQGVRKTKQYSDIDKTEQKIEYTMYYDVLNSRWTPIEQWAFRGFVMSKVDKVITEVFNSTN